MELPVLFCYSCYSCYAAIQSSDELFLYFVGEAATILVKENHTLIAS